jgi:hypothetical protein
MGKIGFRSRESECNMSEDNDAVATPEAPPTINRKGRPQGSKNAPKSDKRRYANELAALQNNVATAGKLLRRAILNGQEPSREMVLAAMDVLGIEEK